MYNNGEVIISLVKLLTHILLVVYASYLYFHKRDWENVVMEAMKQYAEHYQRINNKRFITIKDISPATNAYTSCMKKLRKICLKEYFFLLIFSFVVQYAILSLDVLEKPRLLPPTILMANIGRLWSAGIMLFYAVVASYCVGYIAVTDKKIWNVYKVHMGDVPKANVLRPYRKQLNYYFWLLLLPVMVLLMAHYIVLLSI